MLHQYTVNVLISKGMICCNENVDEKHKGMQVKKMLLLFFQTSHLVVLSDI